MTVSGYTDFAEALLFVHVAKAQKEALVHATLCERLGKMEAADLWHKVGQLISNRSRKDLQ